MPCIELSESLICWLSHSDGDIKRRRDAITFPLPTMCNSSEAPSCLYTFINAIEQRADEREQIYNYISQRIYNTAADVQEISIFINDRYILHDGCKQKEHLSNI